MDAIKTRLERKGLCLSFDVSFGVVFVVNLLKKTVRLFFLSQLFDERKELLSNWVSVLIDVIRQYNQTWVQILDFSFSKKLRINLSL